MTPSPESLVPGIDRYRDMRQAMLAELRLVTCCAYTRIAEKYRDKLTRRLARDKVRGRK